MSKYQLKSNDKMLIKAEQVKKDTTITTQWGDALVTKGNYIITYEDGSQVGMAEQDLVAQYKPVKK